jgi:hypothetical protein
VWKNIHIGREGHAGIIAKLLKTYLKIGDGTFVCLDNHPELMFIDK